MVLRAAWTALGALGCSSESIIRRPVRPVAVHDLDSTREWRRCRAGGRPPPTATLLVETHRSSCFEAVQAQTKQIQRLLNEIIRLSM